jgi:hypothetical protein
VFSPPRGVFNVAEQVLAAVLVVGLVLFSVGWLWLIIKAFGTRWWWGLLCVLPVMVPVFALVHRRRLTRPLLCCGLGLLVAGTAYGGNAVQQVWFGFGPHEQMVDGQRHLTLTGWKRHDYQLIRSRPDTVVLQMANPDVTDAELKLLSGLTRLQELDLNETQVTDAGLSTIAELKQLKRLRLKGTAITDDGFARHLATHPALQELDLRGTAVASKTLRDWKNSGEGRRYLK